MARPWAVQATLPAAMSVSAQRGSARSRASDSRRRASASRTRRSPARTPVETGIAWGGPPPVDRIATVPSSQCGSASSVCAPATAQAAAWPTTPAGATEVRRARGRGVRAACSSMKSPQVLGALALGVMAHPGPDLDVRLRQRAAQRLHVRGRDEPVVLAPEGGDRPVEADVAVREAVEERPAAATASTAARTPGPRGTRGGAGAW